MKLSLIKCIGFLGLALVISCNTNGQKSKADEYMEELLRDKKISGAAVVVLKGSELIFTKNYGYADINKQEAITDSSQFGIMSISKNFIAVAVIQLFDKKLLDLDAPIRKYLDKLPEQYDNVLIYQLLNHTAGVPDYVEVPGYMAQVDETQTPLQVLEPILGKPLAFKPGERNAYSNSGYFLLGLLIEKVSGETLGNYLSKNIFEPAGMKRSFLDDNTVHGKSRIKGYITNNKELKEIAPLNSSQYWAAGAVVTTKADMIKWNTALRNGSILPVNEIYQMMQPSKLADGSAGEYGLGFELMNAPDMKIAGNTGTGVGFNAANLHFINDSLTVVVLTNTSGSNSTMIAKTIRDILLNHSEKATATRQTTKDKLDSVITQLFTDAGKGTVNEAYFKNADTFAKFKTETLGFIQSQGGFKGLEQKGERKNPESIARKYQVSFEKGNSNWVFILSADEKIMAANHM